MTPWLRLLTAITQKVNIHGITVDEFRLAATIWEMKRSIHHTEAMSILFQNNLESSPEDDNRDAFIDSVSNLIDKGFLAWEGDDLQLAFTGEMFIIEIYQIAQSELTKRLFDPELQ
ncbi:hypothetical protein [Photobacterium toruni]|uniref:hypothetical protein n=1 Tax=Photobacterium toruni TaxID=1935446 RepID=UPI00210FC28B|nr:hypothetical protein [Photobacterium toruni]